ncbi:MAG TPA: hypothetical protein VHT51_19135 [Micropepsaceae bacterium]|jgi:hypothetical protein|nr:hypothetical protein [Micropepsaceae bacterium]
MANFDQFFAQIGEFDITNMLARDVEEMESEFTGEFVYKYRAAERKEFFAKPQIRFTQKTVLNDPFELTRRWNENGGKPVRQAFVRYLRNGISKYVQRTDLLTQSICEQIEKRGVLLSPAHRQLISEKLRSKEGQAMLEAQRTQIDGMIGP